MKNGNTGVPTNGKIENINKVESIKCDCKKCYWSKKAYGELFCSYYKKNNPNKKKCIRYYSKKEVSKKDSRLGLKPRTSAKDVSSWQPSFPWERPFY